MNANIKTADQLSWGMWKYVVTGEGSALFSEIQTGIQHIQLCPAGKTAVHAGTFLWLKPGEWMMGDPISESLDIHGDKDVDIKILTTLLGAPPIERDEE